MTTTPAFDTRPGHAVLEAVRSRDWTYPTTWMGEPPAVVPAGPAHGPSALLRLYVEHGQSRVALDEQSAAAAQRSFDGALDRLAARWPRR
jgi:hypothetical protein